MNMKPLEALHYWKDNPYCWPGGYEHIGILSDGEAICHDCLLENWDSILDSTKNHYSDGWQLIGIDVNWEDDSCYCANCSKQLKPEYGDSDETETDETEQEVI